MRTRPTFVRLFKQPRSIASAVSLHAAARGWDVEITMRAALPFSRTYSSQSPPAAVLVLTCAATVRRPVEPGRQIRRRCGDSTDAGTSLYRAFAPDGTPVALKIAASGNAAAALCIRHEAEVLGTLVGTAAVRLVECAEHDGRPVLATAWCRGDDILTASRRISLERGVDAMDALVGLTGAVLKAYAGVHARRIVHGDVHPNNILVDGDGAIVVIDFGHARLLSAESPAPQVARGGVALFFEPELAVSALESASAPPATMSGEQYALAVLAYALFTGTEYIELPLGLDAAMRQIVAAAPRPFARCDVEAWPSVESVLHRALSKRPEQRFTSVAAFGVALRAAGRRSFNRTGLVASERQRGRTALGVLEAAIWRRLKAGAGGCGLPQRPMPPGVESGAAGVALALYRVAAARDDPAALALATTWVAIARGTAMSRVRSGASASVARPVHSSLLRSALGVRCVEALVAHAGADVAGKRRATTAFLSFADRLATEPHGRVARSRSGMLHGATLLFEISDDVQPAVRAALHAYGAALARALLADAQRKVSAAGYRPDPDVICEITVALAAVLRWARATARRPTAM